MKFLKRISPLLLLCSVFLAGCGSDETQPDPGIKADMEKQRGAMQGGGEAPAQGQQGN